MTTSADLHRCARRRKITQWRSERPAVTIAIAKRAGANAVRYWRMKFWQLSGADAKAAG